MEKVVKCKKCDLYFGHSEKNTKCPFCKAEYAEVEEKTSAPAQGGSASGGKDKKETTKTRKGFFKIRQDN